MIYKLLSYLLTYLLGAPELPQVPALAEVPLLGCYGCSSSSIPRPSYEPKASNQGGAAAQGQIDMAGQFEYAGKGSTDGSTIQAKTLGESPMREKLRYPWYLRAAGAYRPSQAYSCHRKVPIGLFGTLDASRNGANSAGGGFMKLLQREIWPAPSSCLPAERRP